MKRLGKEVEAFKLSVENLEWFKDNFKSLKRKYDNQCIVVQKRKVVDSISRYDQIVECLKKTDGRSVLVEFVDSKKMAAFFLQD